MSIVEVPRSNVEVAVRAAFGSSARVIGHETKTLTAPGDNFATTVVCLQVELETSTDAVGNSSDSVHIERKTPEGVDGSCFDKNQPSELSVPAQVNEQINAIGLDKYVAKPDERRDLINQQGAADKSPNTKTWTCIAKTNSKKESTFFKIFSKFAFDNEIKFYKTILPALNTELSKSKVQRLKVSDYYYSNKEEENELIIMEDLRQTGFTMGNKCEGLDNHRCTEVAKELARMHSASVLVRSNHSKQEKDSTNPIQRDKLNGDATGIKDEEAQSNAVDIITGESYLVKDSPIMNIFTGLVQNRITNALDVLSKIKGTEKEISWLKSVEADIPSFLRRMVVDCEPEFLVLCHGDTWSNNFLFSPSLDAVSMVDFQIIRPASLATDLNYLFYTSHCGYFTPIRIETILDAYYEQFAAIMTAQGYKMPFSRQGLSAEVEAKKPWGVMGGILTLPMIFPQQEGEDETTRSTNEKTASDKTREHKVKENSTAYMSDKQHSESESKQKNETTENLNGRSGAGQIELPCNSTFEEKFLKLMKNIIP